MKMHKVLVLNCNKDLVLHFCELLDKKFLKKTFCSRPLQQIPNKKCNFFQNKLSKIWLSSLISRAKHLSFIFRPNLKNFVGMIITKIGAYVLSGGPLKKRLKN